MHLLVNLCKHFCRKRNTQWNGTQRRNTITSIPETRLISSAFHPNQKLLRICHQCGCLCQTKHFFCLQPAVIHHIWGLLLALYCTVAGADSTRPRLNTDISLHPFPAAQPHNSSENTQRLYIFPAGVSHTSGSWQIVQELSPKRTSIFKTAYRAEKDDMS